MTAIIGIALIGAGLAVLIILIAIAMAFMLGDEN